MKKKSCAGRMMRVMWTQSASGVGMRAETLVGEQEILRGEDFAEQDAAAEHDQHGGEDDGERAVAALFVAGLAIAVEDGDERDGGRTADEEVGEQVGKLEGGLVGVLLGPGAPELVDDLDADEAEQAGGDGAEHQQNGRGAGGVLASEGGRMPPVRGWEIASGEGGRLIEDRTILVCRRSE